MLVKNFLYFAWIFCERNHIVHSSPLIPTPYFCNRFPRRCLCFECRRHCLMRPRLRFVRPRPPGILRLQGIFSRIRSVVPCIRSVLMEGFRLLLRSRNPLPRFQGPLPRLRSPLLILQSVLPILRSILPRLRSHPPPVRSTVTRPLSVVRRKPGLAHLFPIRSVRFPRLRTRLPGARARFQRFRHCQLLSFGRTAARKGTNRQYAQNPPKYATAQKTDFHGFGELVIVNTVRYARRDFLQAK